MEAKTMMIATLRWRDEFKVEDAMKETYPDELNVFGHVYGHDKEGRPVVCVAFSLLFVLRSDCACMQVQHIRWR